MKLLHQKITHGQPALGVVKQLWGNTSGFSVKNDPHQRRRRIGIRLDTINRQGEIAHVVTAFEAFIGTVTFTIERTDSASEILIAIRHDAMVRDFLSVAGCLGG